MLNSQLNNMGGTQLPRNISQDQMGVPTDLSSAVPANQSPVAPVISYNIICDNQPKDGLLAKTSEQDTETKQQVLAQLPFQVNTEVVQNEDELFQVIYNRIVAKLEADRDASSAGKYD